MATKVENEKDFLVIKLNKEEAEHLGMGLLRMGDCVCSHCNKICDPEEIYLIPVISDTYCKNCFPGFIKRSTRYKEDIPYEQKKYNYYKEALGVFFVNKD